MECLELVGHGISSRSRAKSVQDMDEEFIKVIRNIHKSKRVNVVFDILHRVDNSSITLMRADKILLMNHDSFARRRGICLIESGSRSPRCGGGRDKLH